MALLTVTPLGSQPVFVAADAQGDGFDEFDCAGRESLEVQNISGSQDTFTLVAKDAMGCPARILHSITYTVPPAVLYRVDVSIFGRQLRRWVGNTQKGRCRIEYGSAASFTVAVKRVL